MLLDARRHAQIHGMMRARGLPDNLLRVRGTVDRHDVSTCTHSKHKPTPPKDQVSALERSLRIPAGDWVLTIGSRQDMDLLQLIGMEFFARCIHHGLDRPAHFPRPYWHVVHGGSYDPLRDGRPEWLEQKIGKVGALVISGATFDAPAVKLEKIRDLLLAYQGIPRIVLVSGGDPLQFVVDKLHRNADRVAFINRSHRRADQVH